MKKLLSIILAIAIIATLMPTAFGAGAETKKIEYVFSFNAYADENGAQNNTSFQKGDLITKTQSRNMYSDHNAWSAAGFSWAVTAQLYKDSLFWNSATGRVSGNGQENDLLSAAMVLEINETGTFIPTLYYTPKTSSPIYNIYLVKKNEADSFSEWSADAVNALLSEYLEEKVSDASCIGTVDMWGSEKSASKELLTVNITEKGEYFLIFVDEGANSAWEALVDSKGRQRATTYITSFTLAPADTQEDVVSAFAIDSSDDTTHSASITPLVAALDGNDIDVDVSATDEDNDGIYTVTAPATDTTGEYTFLYWIKGLTSDKANKIVSLNSTIEEYKPQNEANYLIAVYEKKNAEAEAKAEFYDGNGQLLYTTAADDIDENNVTVNDGVITIPSLPQMANYAGATHWQLYGDAGNTKYGADVTTATLSGNMIFVAQYDDVYVKVNGNSVRYGDSITSTAEKDTENKYFKWWTRTVDGVTEIVSLDREYTFFPWEDCTVEAVYGDKKQIMAGNLRKIVIDMLGNNALMAEFIGLDGAEVAEKGVMLGDKKIAMSTNASQFTITNNISATSAKGYAIIKDGNSFTEITDGSVTLD